MIPTFVIVCGWMSSSILSTRINYYLLQVLGSAIHLTLFQLAFATALGVGMIKLDKQSLSYEMIRKTAPLGLYLSILSISYNIAMNFIPISFLNTVKSTVPIWTCFYCRVIRKSEYSVPTYLSLLPIVGGVGLASFNEAKFNLYGFLLSVCSAWATTLYNLTAKDIMEDKNQQEGIMQTHTSLVSFLILMPFGIFQSSMNSNEPEPTQGVDLFSFHIVWIAILCGVNWYVEMNLAARTIRRVGPLAFSIIDVVRRLVVISSAVVMFGNPISGRNIAGVVIAMCGAVAYNVSRNQPSIKAEKKSENSKTRRESQAQNSGWMKKLENKKSAK